MLYLSALEGDGSAMLYLSALAGDGGTMLYLPALAGLEAPCCTCLPWRGMVAPCSTCSALAGLVTPYCLSVTEPRRYSQDLLCPGMYLSPQELGVTYRGAEYRTRSWADLGRGVGVYHGS